MFGNCIENNRIIFARNMKLNKEEHDFFTKSLIDTTINQVFYEEKTIY